MAVLLIKPPVLRKKKDSMSAFSGNMFFFELSKYNNKMSSDRALLSYEEVIIWNKIGTKTYVCQIGIEDSNWRT